MSPASKTTPYLRLVRDNSPADEAPTDAHSSSQTYDAVNSTAPRDDEAAWIAAAANGDMVAFRRIYDRYLHKVAGQVGRLLGPQDDVEDVVQDVFVQLYKSLPKFRGDSRFSTWLYRLTFNVAVSHRRKVARLPENVELEPFHAPTGAWSKLEARDLTRMLYSILESVNEDAREAFILCDIEGMTLREISEMFDVSINTIAARVRRTREKVVEELQAAAHSQGGRRS